MLIGSGETGVRTAAPEQGQAVLVRGRPATVRGVRSHDGEAGALHLVEIEYIDDWSYPTEDSILWELELDARVLTGSGFPDLSDLTTQPDPPERYGAFVDAVRWSSVSRIPGLDGATMDLVSPWLGAVAVESYQLYPVLKALEMPRVALLLADDVGLGKTIEAGLILTELISRRRARRALVICPASLQVQWREEMAEKFKLDFTVMDRDATYDVQRSYGMDVNPWTVFPRLITSMDFLRQPDVLQQFLAGSQKLDRGYALPWDFLIVDEAHNLSPQSFVDRSDRSRMLEDVVPHFEHRLFLTATPHNGYTANFTGLLEILDPVRFRQKAELDAGDHTHLDVTMIRRLKSEINIRAEERGLPQPFPHRDVERCEFSWTQAERELAEALAAYRTKGRTVLSTGTRRDRRVGRFVFSLLTKRLLSSTYAFARTWWQHVEGYETGEGDVAEVEVAQRRAESLTADDTEKANRENDVARQGAAWLRRHRAELAPARDRVSGALEDLGWGPEVVEYDSDDVADAYFPPDGKWDALIDWVEQRLLLNGDFRHDERVILFTEYKDTLDYLAARLAEAGFEAPQVRMLFGGSRMGERKDVKDAFNDREDPLRILVATDVASEGLNLQTSCRYVFHFEIPWNPMRMEQRNGRVDRHGQLRDVVAFHFTSSEDDDLRFLDRVVEKVNQVREDLGSVGDVIDEAVADRFVGPGLDEDEFEERVDSARETSPDREDLAELGTAIPEGEQQAFDLFEATSVRLGLTGDRLRRVLSESARIEGGELRRHDDHRFRLDQIPARWGRLVDESLRIGAGSRRGAMPYLAFDPDVFMERLGDREVFRSRPDTVLMRLGHPLMDRAVNSFRRRLWDAGDQWVRRWTIAGYDDVQEPIFELSVLMRVTNALREPIHTEVRIYRWDPEEARLALTHEDLSSTSLGRAVTDAWRQWLGEHWPLQRSGIEEALDDERRRLASEAVVALESLHETERSRLEELYEARLAELEREPGQKSIDRMRKQLEKSERQAMQRTFDPEENRRLDERVRRLQRQLEEAEWQRMRTHLVRLRKRLEEDKERHLDQVLPKRFEFARVDLLPVGVELLVPAGTTP